MKLMPASSARWMIRMASSWSGLPPGAEHHSAEAELADRYTGASERSKFHKRSSQLSVAGAALSLDEASTFRELCNDELRRIPKRRSSQNAPTSGTWVNKNKRGHVPSPPECHALNEELAAVLASPPLRWTTGQRR